MKNLLKATINHNESDIPESPHFRKRIAIYCRKKDDGSAFPYGWHTESGEDCEVRASSLANAKRAALGQWGSSAWDLRASWR